MCNQLGALILGLVFLNPLMGAVLAQNQSRATAPARPETEILKTIVFITVEARKPGRLGRSVPYNGTGFLVSVPDNRIPRIPKDRTNVYLVTNRHVAQGIDNCEQLLIDKMYVTLNLKDPINGNRAEQLRLELSPEIHWYFPQDKAIDLAVMPVYVSDKYDFRYIDLDQFLTSEILERKNVVPGDRVLTGGFYSGYAGLHEIQPIMREGILAMVPDGPMTTTLCAPGKVYLADLHVIPGNSGSPIFVIPTLGLGAGVGLGGVPNTFGLLGVVSGYMGESENFTLRASTTWTGALNANSGIAMVMPAQQLRDLLNTPELQRRRNGEAALIQAIQ
jgi:hypothetical protein